MTIQLHPPFLTPQGGIKISQAIMNYRHKIKGSNTINENVTAPIIIHKKELWHTLSKKLLDLRIKYYRAVNTPDGMSVYASTPDDYRKMTNSLKSMNVEFHTFQLKEEKNLRVVIRGLPPSIPDEEILEELEILGYRVHTKQK